MQVMQVLMSSLWLSCSFQLLSKKSFDLQTLQTPRLQDPSDLKTLQTPRPSDFKTSRKKTGEAVKTLNFRFGNQQTLEYFRQVFLVF